MAKGLKGLPLCNAEQTSISHPQVDAPCIHGGSGIFRTIDQDELCYQAIAVAGQVPLELDVANESPADKR